MFIELDDATIFEIKWDGSGYANDSGNRLASFKPQAGVKLFYNDANKLETTATGITVTGNATSTGNIVSGGTVTDSKGNVRSIPSNAQGGAYVAVAADAGKAIYISTGGVTINNNVFAAGDAVTIINNSGSAQTITQGTGVTIHNAADAQTGNRTLAGRGVATIWFAAAATAYITGAGLT